MINVIISWILMSSPLIIASLGMIISEKAGILNFGMEGTMILSAFVSYWVASHFGPIIGFFSSIFLGIVIGIALAITWVKLGVDQVITGVALILFGYGFSTYLSDISGVGKIVPTSPSFLYFILALGLVFIIYVILERTFLGLKISSVGFNPRNADMAGVNVFRIKYACVILSCVLGAVGGSYYPLVLTGNFSVRMTAGVGFIAFVVSRVSMWKPALALLFSILFTSLIGAQFVFGMFGLGIPSQVLLSLPYIAGILAMVLINALGIGKAPEGVGIPYNREAK